MNNNITDIILTLQNINNQIIENNLSLEDISILLLIIYNELILNYNTSPVIKSYITIILYNFIQTKNLNTNPNKKQIINSLIHYNIPVNLESSDELN